jgi:penicillin-binding protein 2
VAWDGLNSDTNHPLLNRAAAGAYAPGSTFKPVTALAALESGKASADTSFYCPGYFELGRATFRCWKHSGHGNMDLRQALEQSCNVYFFNLALQCGPEYVQHMAEALRLGQKTGAELEYEVAGLVPNNAWKKRIYRDAWRDGDTCNMAIGQGALTVTPLQMAMVTATIANGGHVYRPRLVNGTRPPGAAAFTLRPPEVLNEMNWTPSRLRTVQEGMRDVVRKPEGSGKLLADLGFTVAGKTGTAEFGRKEEGKRHAWMIAYAPYEKPRYAVAIVIDEGESGSTTAAPRMRELLSGLFAPPAVEGGRG